MVNGGEKNILGGWEGGGGLIFAPIRFSGKSHWHGGLLPLKKLDLGKGVYLLSRSQLLKH